MLTSKTSRWALITAIVLLITIASFSPAQIIYTAVQVIQNAGSSLNGHTTLNFTGGLTATENVGANRNEVTIANLATGGNPGPIPYVSAAGTLSEDASNLCWDATNHFLGIGTCAPAFSIENLLTGGGAAINAITTYSTIASSGSVILFRRSRGTLGSPLAVLSGSSIGNINYTGYDGSAFFAGANVKVAVDASVSAGVVPMSYAILTGGATPTTRIFLPSAGNVCLGSNPNTVACSNTVDMTDRTVGTGATRVNVGLGAADSISTVIHAIAGSQAVAGTASAAAYLTASNCSNAASPAACSSAAAGAVAIPTGITSVTLQVNTTAVTANSRIMLLSDDSLTIAATTCNSTLATLVGGMAVTARNPGVSFTITYNGTIATNPLCVSYWVVN